jgi:hypothetical protein
MYKLAHNVVIRTEDGATIPADKNNSDYAKYLEWVAAGNVAISADPEPTSRVIRDWEFRNRFTSAQLVGIMRAAMTGDDNAAVVWLRLSTASDGVDLDDPDNVAGLNYIAATYPALNINASEVLA